METNDEVSDSPVYEGKWKKVEDRGGVQATVQHNSGRFELENIARQSRMTRQTILERQKKRQ